MLLLIERAKLPMQGLWDLVGGFCEYGEHPEDATVREFEEESGIAVKIASFLGIYMDWYSSPIAHNLTRATLNVVYEVEPIAQPLLASTVVASEEGRVAWFGLNDLPRLAFPRSTGRAIETFIAQKMAQLMR